jgi:hypothetical protein
MAIQTKSVYSSHVDTVSHNDETNELTVRWDTGKTSVYSGVPANLAKEVMDAWSVGTALHNQIKGKYDHHYSKGGK